MNSQNKNEQPIGSRDTGRLATPRHAALLAFVVLGLCIFAKVSHAESRGEIPRTLARAVEEVLAPYTPRAKEALRVDLNNPTAIYEHGDYFFLEVEALDEDAFIYVDYFQLDGNVVHILPSAANPENRLTAGRPTLLGDPDGEVLYEILSPFGREMLVVTATHEPLFSGNRDEVEPGPAYLQALRAGLSRVATRGRPAAVVIAIETFPAGSSVAARAAMQGSLAVTSGSHLLARRPEIPSEPADNAAETTVSDPPHPRVSEAKPLPGNFADGPTPGAANSAAPSPRTASATISKAKSYYLTNIAPRLARMAEHPEDNENVSALAAAYGPYARHLSDAGEVAKARRTLNLALALDPGNSELAALYPEIQGVSAAQQTSAKDRLTAAAGAPAKASARDPGTETAGTGLRRARLRD